MKIKVTSLLIITALTAVLLGGCGGGGGGGGGGSAATTVSGTVAKGPVAGATVVIYAITAGAKGAELGRFAPTLADGKYAISIGAYTGPILIESTGGTYTDEATGTAALPVGGVFRAFADHAAGNVNVAVTPLTEMAAFNILAAAPVTAATIKSNNAAIANTFGVSDIIGVQPANPAAAPPVGTSQESIDYTLALATFAKYMQLNTQTLAQAMTALGSAAPSNQTLLDLAAARNAFISSPQNLTGVTGNPAATTITLKLSTKGTLAVANAIGGVQVTLNLPAGVSIANTAGDASASVAASGVAATGSTVGASFVDAAPDTVRVILVKQPNGFGIGEYATLTLTKTAGAIVTPAHIVATGFKAANGIVGNGELGAALADVTHTFTATFQ